MTMSGQYYHCSAGETFDSVALMIYGQEKYACELLNANPSYCRIPIFVGGEILALPVIDIPANPDDITAMPAEAPWKE